jgi:putative exosortase-associated protein (TIGR04073 family)
MRNTFPLLAMIMVAGALASGCAGPEKKLARGFSNLGEPIRLGEVRRSVEQDALFDNHAPSYSRGIIDGINRTFARTGIGIYEIVTAPFPTPGHGYDPICTSYLTPRPVYPDSYRPTMIEDAMFATDTNVGFSGGDIAPFFPGSRFRIFDTH